jgi:uroporphyrinogen decarboxylase
MNSRERVLAAVNHQEPDKVPIDLGGTQCSTLTVVANDNLKEYLNIKKEEGELVVCPLTEAVSLLDEISLLFETDCRTVRLKAPRAGREDDANIGKGFTAFKVVRYPEGHEFIDDLGTVWKKNRYDYAPVKFPFAGLTSADLDSYPWPDPYDSGRVDGLRDETLALRENTNYAIVADIMVGGPFEQACRSRGFEQFMLDLAWDPVFAHKFLGKLTDVAVGMWDAQLSAIGDCVDIVCQGDDLGMQTGLQISVDMYRKFVKPCHERIFSFIHSKTNAKAWLHSCGSVYAIIPDLIDVGVDILNPVQVRAKNMDLERLKREFGRDIAFWGGGVDIQSLPDWSPQEVEERVKRVLDIMAPGGGYVFAATHNILPETPGEKTYAAYMRAVKYRDHKS